MASDDDEDHPWSDRERLREDMRHAIHKVRDLFHSRNQPHAGFTVRHGVSLESVLARLVAAVRSAGTDDTLLDRLAAAAAPSTDIGSGAPAPRRQLPGEPRPIEVQLSDSLASVREERDRLLEAQRLGEQTVAQLTRDLNEARRRLAARPSPAEAANISRVEIFRERADGLEEQLEVAKCRIEELERLNTDLSAKLAAFLRHGPVEDYAAYRALGSVDDLVNHGHQLSLLAHVFVAQLGEYDRTVRDYEAVLGPLLLQYGRRSRQLDGLLHGIAAVAPNSVGNVVSTPFAAILPAIGLEDGSIPSVPEALAVLEEEVHRRHAVDREEGEVDADASVLLHGSVCSDALDVVRSLAQRVTSVPNAIVDGLLRAAGAPRREQIEDDPARAGRKQVRASSTAEPSTTDTSAGGLTGTTIDLTSDVGSPSSRKGKNAKKKKKGLVDTGIPERFNESVFEKIRARAEKEHRRLRKAHGWPARPPVVTDFPKSIDVARQFAWRLGLHIHEICTPQPSEYPKVIKHLGGRLATLEEIEAIYATQPWLALADPPQPITFDPESPTFKGFFEKTKKLYRQVAWALFERANYFLVENIVVARGVDSGEGDAIRLARRRSFLQHRRKRNSDLTQPWAKHLHRVIRLLKSGRVDLDFLLDPFLYWPPCYGVVPLVASPGQTLADRMDAAHANDPSRMYYRDRIVNGVPIARTAGAPQHPSVPLRDRLLMKFSVPGVTFGPGGESEDGSDDDEVVPDDEVASEEEGDEELEDGDGNSSDGGREGDASGGPDGGGGSLGESAARSSEDENPQTPAQSRKRRREDLRRRSAGSDTPAKRRPPGTPSSTGPAPSSSVGSVSTTRAVLESTAAAPCPAISSKNKSPTVTTRSLSAVLKNGTLTVADASASNPSSSPQIPLSPSRVRDQ